MKLRDWLAAILILVAIPAQAAPTIRGLFVGIDKYRYSRDHVANADFNDLKGAVADAIAMAHSDRVCRRAGAGPCRLYVRPRSASVRCC